MGKATRDRSARERLAEQRRIEAQRDRRKRMLTAIGGALVLIVAVVGLVILVNSGKDKSEEYAGAIAPTTREADGSIVMAKAGVTAPVLEIYEDFQCPACKNLEDTSGDTIKRLAAEGKVKVVFRPFRLFSQDPLKSNSERAANAALCAPADKWVPFHDRIFANQPREGSVGFENDDLIDWAGEAGITGAEFESCVKDGQKNAQVTAMTEYALNTAQVESTPTVKLDGENITDAAFSPGDLEKAVAAAK
ncbi:DsbA family protein [Actinocorallia populi]|uniref:DsbA family protein n=1 Tax=Actinocorallia populi TaxID=2079200 RepID=UPI000D08F23A|nr:thioredoxin domain-containing protein [Actinocorallia populi]